MPYPAEVALMMRCPHFGHCSAVECPLDPLQGKRGPEDAERCVAQRKTRLRVLAEARAEGITLKLKHDGLLVAEVRRDRKKQASKAAWDAMPEEQRQARLAKLTPFCTRKKSSEEGEATIPLPEAGRSSGECLPEESAPASPVRNDPSVSPSTPLQETLL